MPIMKIIRKSCAQGAREAQGLTVIIDVFRAFTCEPFFFHFNAREVILEADPHKATAMKREHPDFVLVGEVNEVPIEGADLGNSPTDIVRRGEAYFRGKTVVHRTTAGVTGVAAALEKADEIVLEEIKKAGLYEQIWQSFAIILPIKSVGVMGDERTYENVVALRCVNSIDGMTADWVKLPNEVLGKIANRIINSVKGVNRVVYDVSSKPPATIEWE